MSDVGDDGGGEDYSHSHDNDWADGPDGERPRRRGRHLYRIKCYCGYSWTSNNGKHSRKCPQCGDFDGKSVEENTPKDRERQEPAARREPPPRAERKPTPPDNGCNDCGHTWVSRHGNKSAKCPACGKRDVVRLSELPAKREPKPAAPSDNGSGGCGVTLAGLVLLVMAGCVVRFVYYMFTNR